MHEPSFDDAVDEILRRDERYHRDAYHFVREALDHTQKSVTRGGRERDRSHVTGQQLVEGIRPVALAQFGPMAKTVLEHWGVRNCRDFGEIVFNLVEAGVLAKTAEDRIEDFEEGYTFEEAFVRPFLPEAKRRDAEERLQAEG